MSRGRRGALAMFALVVLVLGLFAVAPVARADTLPIFETPELPGNTCEFVAGQTICDSLGMGAAKAPTPQRPDSGVSGLFLTNPAIAPTQDPFAEGSTTSIYESSGLAGMGSMIYGSDELLSENGGDITQVIGVAGENGAANTITDIGLAVTGITAIIGQVAFDPTWVGDLLGEFARDTASAVEVKLWVPFLGLGLIAGGLIAALMFVRRGDLSGAWSATLSAVLVVGVGLVVLTYPVTASEKLQEVTMGTASLLGNSDELQDDPSGAGGPAPEYAPAKANELATAQIVTAVHYNGWARRTLGSDSAACATEYGPTLFKAGRYSWAELNQIRDGGASVRKEIDERKAKEFTEAADAMKVDYPDCYAALQGTTSRFTMALIELGASLAANAFRFMAFLLMIAGMVYLVFVGLAALAMAPYLVTEPARGARRAMLDAAVRSCGYAILATIYSWAFSLYVGFIMAPGIPQWVSLALLIVGTAGFWTMLAPHRKLLSFKPGGYDGSSKAVRWMFGKAVDHLSRGLISSKAVEDTTEALADHKAEQQRRAPASSESYSSPPLPAQASLPAGTPLEGKVMDREPVKVPLELEVSVQVIPGEVVDAPEYRRMDETPSAASFAVDTSGQVYTRKVDA